MPIRTLADQSAAGSLTKGKTVAKRSTGGMLRTISAARGSNVAKHSPGGAIGATSRAKGTAVARRSPGGKIGTICRAKGSPVVSKATGGAGLRTLSQAKGSEVARTTVASSTRTYRAKSAVARGTVVTRAPEPGVVDKVVPAELLRYQGTVYLGGRKRSIGAISTVPLCQLSFGSNYE